MIKVSKPKVAPSTLSSIMKRGIADAKKICDLYDIDALPFATAKAYSILNSIYNAPKVKSTLKTMQKKKCCFCEKTQNDEYGAVEHFRPKLGYQIARGGILIRPGYYWKGYSWENLFFVCGSCNTAKGNIFPLKNEADRWLDHNSMDKEIPLLLNPAGRMNPRRHIKFVDEFPFGITVYGKRTVEACELDRIGLNEERRNHLNEIEDRIATMIRGIDPVAVKLAKKYLRNCVKADAKFSAMASDYLIKSKIIIT